MTEQQRSMEGGVIDNSISRAINNQILSKSQPDDHQPETITHAQNIDEVQI